MEADPDAALALLADLTARHRSPKLRELARRLAGRIIVDVSRRGRARHRGVGKILTQPFRPDGGDLDLDASFEALAEAKASRGAPDAEQLRVRGWRKPATALCLVVDRSGSMGGRPLATSALAAAAVAHRAPADYSVLAFGPDVVVAKAQDAPKPSDQVVTDVLALRGFGTTDLVAALRAATVQLQRSPAGRRVAVLLSDCRATTPGDVVAAATGSARAVHPGPGLRRRGGPGAGRLGRRPPGDHRWRPSQIPDALAAVLGEYGGEVGAASRR